MTRRGFAAGAVAIPLAAALGVGLRSAGAAQITVTMVTDTAGLGDQNFNDSAKRGLDRAVKDFGIKLNVIESQEASQYAENLRNAAEGSDLTVGVGFNLTDAIDATAQQYPDKKFLIIDADSKQPNLLGVTFKEQEGAFLVGVVAGLFTKTNKIGVVGGQRIPPVIRYEDGFKAGIMSVNSKAQILVAYADTFGDPNLGAQLTTAQYNQGADIVFPIAGLTGVGSFTAAKDKGRGVWVIAADVDQSQLGAQYQLCVSQKGVDVAAYDGVKAVVDGTFKGGNQKLGLKEGGVGLGSPTKVIPAEVLTTADRYKAAIMAGTLVVPSTDDELKAFKPVPPSALPAATPGA